MSNEKYKDINDIIDNEGELEEEDDVIKVDDEEIEEVDCKEEELEDEVDNEEIEDDEEDEEIEEDDIKDIESYEDSNEVKITNYQFEQLSSKLELKHKDIECDSIVLSNFKKISRKETLQGLDGLVRQWNVVAPIHVLALDDDDDSYLLLDGLRRLVATMKNGNKTIPALVWNFEDKEEGRANANLIALMINRSQKYSVSEQWDLLQQLKSKNAYNPTLCEYLLQLEPGDAMKLEDVMTAEGDYDEIRMKLLEGKCTIDAAYKKLCNARKKEDKLAKEDTLSMPTGEDGEKGTKRASKGSGEGVSDVVNPNEEGIEADTNSNLSMEEVKEILEMSGNAEDVDLDEVEDRSEEVRGPEVQDKHNRHVLDKDLRTAILSRDNFKCQCCGNGGMSYLPILTVHHRVPVAVGGPDKEENLITLCQNCHMRLHVYTMKGLRVNKEELTEEEMKTLKKIYFYGNEALDAFNKKHIKKSEQVKIMEDGAKHQMPGANLKENNAAYDNSEHGIGETDEDVLDLRDSTEINVDEDEETSVDISDLTEDSETYSDEEE